MQVSRTPCKSPGISWNSPPAYRFPHNLRQSAFFFYTPSNYSRLPTISQHSCRVLWIPDPIENLLDSKGNCINCTESSRLSKNLINLNFSIIFSPLCTLEEVWMYSGGLQENIWKRKCIQHCSGLNSSWPVSCF